MVYYDEGEVTSARELSKIDEEYNKAYNEENYL